MSFISKRLKQLTILVLSTCVLVLAGCGGGDDEGGHSSVANSSNGGFSLGAALLCTALVLTTGDDSCVTAAVSGSSSSSSSGSSGGSVSSGGSSSPPPSAADNNIYLAANNEMEPNNELINANIPQYSSRPDPSDQTGWIVNGSANDFNDTRDAFALTPHRAFRYWIALCPPGDVTACYGPVGMDPVTLFWRLLDQDGNEIASSQGTDSNKTLVTLEAGVLYYIVVDAGDTMGVNVQYKLKAFEMQPL